ncbi:MAG: FadR family transcriptional regulator, partial [Clostridiales bacterium]|nr:FadR family transcriptional regulator [Clostridiales bacterium]
YNSAHKIFIALKERDKARAVAFVEEAISNSISGSREIYEE